MRSPLRLMLPLIWHAAQMAQWWRRGEYATVIRFYQSASIPIFNMVTAGSFEGGDFDIIEPECVLIGHCGERTQEQSAVQVAGWFEAKGWGVRLDTTDPDCPGALWYPIGALILDRRVPPAGQVDDVIGCR